MFLESNSDGVFKKCYIEISNIVKEKLLQVFDLLVFILNIPKELKPSGFMARHVICVLVWTTCPYFHWSSGANTILLCSLFVKHIFSQLLLKKMLTVEIP